jgi:AcrR family transcriptional regulator
MRLLDHHGLEGLTMRRLAQDLGVQPSALYWHVADKQTLLAALSREILRGSGDLVASEPAAARRPSSGGWEDALRRAAGVLRDRLLAHRDGAEVVSSSLALGLVRLPLIDWITPALASAGASPHIIDTVAATLGHFAIGATFHEQQRAAARQAGVIAEAAASARGPDADGDQDFDAGVALIVAGTAVLLAAPSPAREDARAD